MPRRGGIVLGSVADELQPGDRVTYLGPIHPPVRSWKHVADIAGKELAGETLIIADPLGLVARLTEGEPIQAVSTVRAARSADRVLIESSNLIGDDESDVAFLANLCAGRDVLPWRPSEIQHQYHDIHLFPSIVRGWLMPVQRLALYGVLFNALRMQIPNVKPTAQFQSWILRLIDGLHRRDGDHFPAVDIVPAPSPFAAELAPSGIRETIADASRPMTNMLIGTEHEDMARAMADWIQKVRTGGEITGSPIDEEIRQVVEKLISLAASRERTMRFGTLTFAMSLLFTVYRILVPRPQTRTISGSKIAAQLVQLVKIDRDLPASRTVSVPYSQSQMEMWILWTFGRLDDMTLVRLGIFEDVEAASILGDRAYKKDVYEKVGLCIGNLGEDPPKFDALLDEIRAARGSVIVHTRFGSRGRDILVPLLRRRRHEEVRILCEEDQDGWKLPASCDTLILLEPVPKRRRDALAALTGAKDVVQFCCSILHPKIWLMSALFTFRKWLEFTPEVFYTERYARFSQSRTPDELVRTRQKELDAFEAIVVSKLRKP